MGCKRYFNDVAGQWDLMRKSFFSDDVREKALAAADVQSGKLAADIGAGTGFVTEGLIREGLNVIAVDSSRAMLEEMRKKFEGVDSIDYRLAESKSLPIQEQTLDYIFANMYLHHVDSPQEAIAEMVRILKPGGKIVITDLDEHDYEVLRSEQHDRWLGFKREDIKKWFIEAGLVNVSVDCAGEDCCDESKDSSKTIRISLFLASGEKQQKRN